MSNKDVWKMWINYYNKEHYDVTGSCYARKVENRFFKVVPKSYENLMAALISCLKWHPNNPFRQNNLCGFCYLHKNSCDNCPRGFCYLHKNSCDNCPLDKLGKNCNDFNSMYNKADDALSHREAMNNKKVSKAEKDFYKVLLSIYKDEYEKLFGTDWNKE